MIATCGSQFVKRSGFNLVRCNEYRQQRRTSGRLRISRQRFISMRWMYIVLSVLFLVTEVLGQSGPTGSLTIATRTSTTSSAAPTSTQQDDGNDDEGTPVSGTGELPSPFDTNIGKGFTTKTCPAFFQVFLEDPEFKKCLPLSAMLQNSKSFFDITKKSGFATTRVLDVSCSADFVKCSKTMKYYAKEIKTNERCGPDIADKNQLAVQAYAAFLAYPALFKGGCLKSESGSYCYVDAVTNVTSPSDSHIYFLPLGIKLPGGSRPTCSKCTQDTMSVFQQYSGDKSQPLYDTFLPAAQQLNMFCGPTFVNTTIIQKDSSSNRFPARSTASSIFTMAVVSAAMFFL